MKPEENARLKTFIEETDMYTRIAGSGVFYATKPG
jgi:hypothetical protein